MHQIYLFKHMKTLGIVVSAFLLLFNSLQTYRGYSTAFDDTLIPIGLMVMVILILSFLLIRIEGEDEPPKKNFWALLYFLFALCLSLPATFNALYGLSQQDKWVKNELVYGREQFHKLQVAAINALRDTTAERFEKDIKNQIQQLTAQILNDGDLGFGVKAISRLEAIERLMGKTTPYERLLAKDRDTTSLKILAKKYEEAILRDLAARVDTLNPQLSKNIKIWGETVDKQVDKAMQNTSDAKLFHTTLDMLKKYYNMIRTETHGRKASFSYEAIQLKEGKIVSFVYTFTHLTFDINIIGAFLATLALGYFPLIIRLRSGKSFYPSGGNVK